MAITKHAVGDYGWGSAYREVIDRVNAYESRYITGRYYTQPSGPSHSAVAQTLNRLRVAPRIVDMDSNWDRIGAHVTVAASTGGTLRFVVYSDSSGYPGTLLVDSGTVTATSTGLREATISLSLTPGLYWVGAVAQTAAATVQSHGSGVFPAMGLSSSEITGNSGNAVGYFLDSITGAAPSTFTAGAAVGGNAVACWMRKAA